MNIQQKIYQEEVVQYIAHRHHLTPQEIIAWFLPLEANLQDTCLEANEIEIIRDLIRQDAIVRGDNGNATYKFVMR